MDGPAAAQLYTGLDSTAGHGCHLCLAFDLGVPPNFAAAPSPYRASAGTPCHLSGHFSLLWGFRHLFSLTHLFLILPGI